MSPIDNYLKNVTPEQRKALKHVRDIALTLVPEPQEVISYGVPTIKYKGTYVIYFAAYKNHMSLYPGAPLDLKEKLKGFKMAKGTIQFTHDKPVPDDIIKELVKRRVADIDNKA